MVGVVPTTWLGGGGVHVGAPGGRGTYQVVRWG